MSKRIYFFLYVCIMGSLLIGLSIHLSWGETHVESSMESRSVLALHVQEKELQTWVPESMQIVSTPKGPWKSANLFIVFNDVLRLQDPQGKLAEGGGYQEAVFTVPVKQKKSGKMGYLVIYGFSNSPQHVPGPYKVFSLASVRRKLVRSTSSFNAGEGSDTWEIKDSSGVLIDFHVGYKLAVPKRAKGVQRVFSGAEPAFFRIYKVDFLFDVLKSIPAKIDRTTDYRLKVSVPKLRKLFDGGEQLVGIVLFPAYVREVFLP